MNQEMTCGWDVETRDRTGWVVCGRAAKARALENLGANRLVCGVHARSARALGYDLEDLPGPGVRVGQVWTDADYRNAGRTLRVDTISDGRAVCTILTNADGHQRLLDDKRGSYGGQDMRGKTVRIRLDRFRPTSTGYRLVTDVPKETNR